MALCKNITLENGLTVENAYIRIASLSGTKYGLDITVHSYVSQQAYQDDKPFLERKIYSFVPDVGENSPNFIKQGYEYLKTLSEYQGAVDC
jgi:hypothetical protein